jgi:hypothetical protein
MTGGWIKLHRELSDHWLWKKKPFSPGQAWIDILIEANHEDNKTMIKGQLIECKRGQSLFSVMTWQKRWGWSRQKVRTFLKLLQSDSMIEQNTTSKTTILTICNYDIYQSLQPIKQPALNQHLTSTQPALNHKQEYKNERNKEIIFRESVLKFNGSYPEKMLEDFIRYWTEPNKSRTKLRFELEKTWEIGRRLATWASRDKSIIYENNRRGPRDPKIIPAADHDKDRLHPGLDK